MITRHQERAVWAGVILTGLLGLMLVTVGSVVVWNTQLASLAGIIAASLGFGAGLGVFTTLLGQRRSVHSRP